MRQGKGKANLRSISRCDIDKTAQKLAGRKQQNCHGLEKNRYFSVSGGWSCVNRLPIFFKMAAISPDAENYDQTLSTLKYGKK